MREIKFRAWNGKVMIDDVGILDGVAVDRATITYDTPHSEVEKLKNAILMQFTGLLDKNGTGKEIYQGDLVRALPSGYEPRGIYEVVWWEERMMWALKDEFGGYSPLWAFIKDHEVIGNIYENPDLLKQN